MFRVSSSTYIPKEVFLHHRQKKFRKRRDDGACLLIVLKCFRIDLNSRKSKRGYCFNRSAIIFLLVHFMYMDCILTDMGYMIVVKNVKIFLSKMINSTFVLLIWYIMQFKARGIQRFLQQSSAVLHGTQRHRRRSCQRADIALLALGIIPVLYPFIGAYTIVSKFTLMYFWIIEEITFTTYVLLYLKEVSWSLLIYVFPGIATLLYSSVCCKITRRLSEYKSILEKSLAKNDSQLLSFSLLASYLTLLDIIENFEDTFSSVALILTLSNGLSLFILMATAFLSKSNELAPYALLKLFMTVITSGVYFAATVISASQIPLEVEKNVKYFKKIQDRFIVDSLSFHLNKTQLILIKDAVERRTTTLSGCQIVYFTRAVLVTILGALITYGLLIMQMQ